jgi:glycyl-tRNA synthetase beta chain
MPDLLIELFSEEIPARMQARAADDLKKLVTNGLVEAGLTYASAAAFSTPRRLTLTIEGMLDASPSITEERETPKGNILFAMIKKPGRPAAEIVAEVLETTIRNFPWPKSMRWGTGSLRWVRPLHSILCILTAEDGAQVVPMNVDGIEAGATTRGHRFLAPGTITVSNFDDYAAKLKRAFVVLDPAERRDAIWHDATNMAFANGLEVVEDAGLLAEVAGLVEWPVVLMGRIGDTFLDLPPEVLQTSMKEHQKFFSVRNPKTGRIERFITVANRTTADDGATILAGNVKVLSARLSDAKFFWENDLRIATSDAGMQIWVDRLSNVTFHNELGTQAELISRMEALAGELAPMVGADADEAREAARFAKADLSSEMVYEFPELQGLMGSYYAKAAGKSDAIAAAAQDHYAPLGPSDDVPTAPVSIAVALAEKIDKLTGFWWIREKPTGSKDPFALRRAGLGVIRTLVENDIMCSLRVIFPHAFRRVTADSMCNEIGADAIYSGRNENWNTPILHSLESWQTSEITDWIATSSAHEDLNLDERLAASEKIRQNVLAGHPSETADLLSFLHDRLKVYLKDQGIRHDIIDACIAMDGNDDLTLLVKRAKALSDTLKTDDGENLIQGFKRANNILSQAEEADGVEYSFGADVKFAETDEERALFDALGKAEAQINPAMAAQDFNAAMSAMASLRGPIDAFFNAVQVNSDNSTVRRNRLNLLSRIRTICSSVADLTKIDG